MVKPHTWKPHWLIPFSTSNPSTDNPICLNFIFHHTYCDTSMKTGLYQFPPRLQQKLLYWFPCSVLPYPPICSLSLTMSSHPENLLMASLLIGNIMEITSHDLPGPIWPCLILLTCLISDPTAVTFCLSNTSLLSVAVMWPAYPCLGEGHSSNRCYRTCNLITSRPLLKCYPWEAFLDVFSIRTLMLYPFMPMNFPPGDLLLSAVALLYVSICSLSHLPLCPYPSYPPLVKIQAPRGKGSYLVPCWLLKYGINEKWKKMVSTIKYKTFQFGVN